VEAVSRALPPELAERYEVRGELGRGTFGTVLEALDKELDRPVALKLLTAAPKDAAMRFDREARATARLEHPGVVRVYDHGVCQDGQRYIVYELIEGEDLSHWKGPPPTPPEVRRWGASLARALAAAHASGVLHRDVKPANLILDRQGQPRLCDFGLARDEETREGAAATATGMILGTPAFMAPELIHGHPHTWASDQFALAATLYELATGARPFDDSRLRALLEGEDGEGPVPCPELEAADAKLARILRRSMHPDPDKRWPDLEALAEALERPPAGTPEEGRRKRTRPRPRPRYPWGPAAGATLALGLIVWWALPAPPTAAPTAPASVPPSTEASPLAAGLDRLHRLHDFDSEESRLPHVYRLRDELLDPRFTLAVKRLTEMLPREAPGAPPPLLYRSHEVLLHVRTDLYEILDTALGHHINRLPDQGRALMTRTPEVQARVRDLEGAFENLSRALAPQVEGDAASQDVVLLWALGVPLLDSATLPEACDRILRTIRQGPDTRVWDGLLSMLDRSLWSEEGDPRMEEAQLQALIEGQLAAAGDPRLAAQPKAVGRLLRLAVIHATRAAARSPTPPDDETLARAARAGAALAAHAPALPAKTRASLARNVLDLVDQRRTSLYPLHPGLNRHFERLVDVARALDPNE
jgi:serine/threonine-protein kinase